MKPLRLIVLLCLVVASACGIVRKTPQEKQAEARRIQEMLDARNYTIDIGYMIPLRGSGKPVSIHSIRVAGDTLTSYLPYFGEARMVPYGGGKGLNFEEKIASYSDSGSSVDSGASAEKRTITIAVKNEEDSYVFTLTVFEGGDTHIHVHSVNRDDISYHGTLRVEGGVSIIPSGAKNR